MKISIFRSNCRNDIFMTRERDLRLCGEEVAYVCNPEDKRESERGETLY